MPQLQEDKIIPFLESVKADQSIANEREKIDANIQRINAGEFNDDMIGKIMWTPDEAIQVLEEAKTKHADPAEADSRIAQIKELVVKVDNQQKVVDEISQRLGPKLLVIQSVSNSIKKIESGELKVGVDIEEDAATLNSKLIALTAEAEPIQKEYEENTAILNNFKKELADYITESIDSLNQDDVDRGALGGIVREHRSIQSNIDTIAFILGILALISFVFTIIVWFTKLYLLRMISVISDLVLTLFIFVIPLIIWSIEFKWPYEIAGTITYGMNLGLEYLLVLLSAVAVVIVGFAFVSGESGKSNK